MTPEILLFPLALLMVAWSICITVFRLQNIGKSGWWVLAQFVPLLNIYISYLCLCAPAGYEDSKELDTAGKITVGVILVLFILLPIILVLS